MAAGSSTPARRARRRGTPWGCRLGGGRPRGAASEASPGPAGRVNGTALPRETGTTAAPRREPAASEPGPRRGQGQTGDAGAANPPTTATAIVTGASLSADELCAASGLSLEEVAGLESFGLVESVTVAGIETYDEDALTMANLAAAFGSFGIEPRHLRLYRNAADRELGLIEQVVIPLLRQRNPESRQKAVERADELAALGQSMRATLLRQALRRHLGG